MIRLIIAILVLTISGVNASELKNNFNYQFCNHHKFTYFFLKVYDTYLCLDDRQYFYPEKIYETNFSLAINYNMSFDRDELAKSSLEEMARYYKINKNDQIDYFEKLLKIFPDVKKKDVIEARYNKKGFVEFYHNQKLTGEIQNPRFSEIFLDIWLYKNNKHKKLTKDLFKNEQHNQ